MLIQTHELVANENDLSWRFVYDDNEEITEEWLKWVGFRKVRFDHYLDGFSFGPQIEYKCIDKYVYWMQSPHNMVPVTKRWEVRALLSVHRRRLLEAGYSRLWESYQPI